MEHKSSFIITGRVARKFIGERWAAITIKVETENRSPRIDCVAFDPAVRDEIEELDETWEVRVGGEISMTTVKAKGGKPIFVDGFEKWVPQLIIDEILNKEQKLRRNPAPDEQSGPPPSDDDIPF